MANTSLLLILKAPHSALSRGVEWPYSDDAADETV